MDRKLVLIIIMVWAVWYLTRKAEQQQPEEPTPEDPTMKNIKIVMERAKKPVKLKFNFKKSEE